MILGDFADYWKLDGSIQGSRIMSTEERILSNSGLKTNVVVSLAVALAVYGGFWVLTKPDSLSNGTYACLITPITGAPLSAPPQSALAQCTKNGSEFVVQRLLITNPAYGTAAFPPGIYFANELDLSGKVWRMTLHLKGLDGVSGPSLMAEILK